ncbi:MAG TPA: hypothetical protein VLM79_21425 [Kofleriaceae bacterium]|nr:hypothetical protein [Kofleriaceae bacterium]
MTSVEALTLIGTVPVTAPVAGTGVSIETHVEPRIGAPYRLST